jgi:hypothetical protein
VDGARIEDLCLSFVVPGKDHIQLTDNGSALDVTLDNAQDFVDLMVHQCFHESVKI